jgi:hypothetical protein
MQEHKYIDMKNESARSEVLDGQNQIESRSSQVGTVRNEIEVVM